jgi:protein disulfide-isomerase A1
VLVLGKENFQEALETQQNIMVEFYAPWCGHCKQLAPHYAEAAKTLQGEVPVAKVDCTVEKEICGEQQVRGFPTLKFFQSGKPVEYQGARTAEAIVSFIRKNTGPAAIDVTQENLELFTTMDAVVVLGLFEDGGSDEAKEFLKFAEKHRSRYQFGLAHSLPVRSHYKVENDKAALVVAGKNLDAAVTYKGEWTAEKLQEFVVAESFPVLGEIGPETYQGYMDRGLPFLWIFVDASEFPSSGALGSTLAAVKSVAADFKGKFSAVYLDGDKYSRHRNQLGHTGDLPGALLENSQTSKKYLFSQELTADNLRQFLQSYVDGTLEPFLKSEEIPETQEGPVTVVVGKTFESIVFDDSKDVFVEFYAPWCGHCKSLAPTYDTLAQHYASVSDLVIAKVDVTSNDVPEQIEGFPTLILYKKGSKGSPVKYNGDRTLQDLRKFLSTHSTAAATLSSDDLAEEDVHDEL